MRYAKKVVAWFLCVCLVLSMFSIVPMPVQAAEDDVIRITCVGDSITDGYPEGRSEAYPAKMQEILGDGYQVTNVGVSGSTVIRTTNNCFAKTDSYQTGLASKPDIVIMMIGTNDAVSSGMDTAERQAEFRKDYIALIEDFKNCGTNPKIILAVPTTSVDEKNKEDNRDVNNEAYLIPIIKDIAKEYGIQLLDAHSYTGSWTRNDYLGDGLHPNAAGYEELAKFFANAVLGYTEGFAGDIQADTNYMIKAKSSDMAMSIDGNSKEDNAGLCQMNAKGYASQVWQLVPTDDGYYQIVNNFSQKVLDVPYSSKEQGTQIIQFAKGTGDNQKWKLEATGDGYFRITPKLSQEQALNVSGNSKAEGGIIVQWPYNGDANEQWRLEVVNEVKRNPVRITCVGDSITDGYPEGRSKAYPAKMQEYLGDGYQVTNVGVSGSTVIRTTDNCYAKTDSYKTGLASKPDIVIMMIGTNDAVSSGMDTAERQAEFRKDYIALMEEFKNCGTNPKMILAVPTTSVDEKNKEDDRDNKNEAYLIPIIKDIAKEYNVQLLDTHTYTGSWTRNDNLGDGLHPNATGYEELGKFFANAVIGYTEGITADIQTDTKYSIVSKSSKKALTIQNYSNDNGALLCQEEDRDYVSQVWQLVPTEDGYYQIINESSKKALDVPNSSTAEGTQITQYDKGNKDNQKWKFEATGDGHFRITPKLAPNQALNISGSSKDDGAAVIQWPYAGAENEQWMLERVENVNANPQVEQTPTEEMKILEMEWEVGTLGGGAKLTNTSESSNGYYVGFIGGTGDGRLTLSVDAQSAGMRTLNIYYATEVNRSLDVIVNGTSTPVDFAANGSWNKTGETPKTVEISLMEGKNTIQLAGVDGAEAPNVDKFELEMTEAEIISTFNSLIDSIPENVTNSAQDKALITGISFSYDKLDEETKSYITNAEKLENAILKLEEASKGAEENNPPQEEPDVEASQNAVKEVMEEIAALGTITLDSEDSIKAVREAYDALTDEEKLLVTNYDVLKEAEETYAQVKADEEEKEQVQAVIDRIAVLGTITLESEEAIQKVREAYDALTDEQKLLVTNYDVLESAEETYSQLKEQEQDDGQQSGNDTQNPDNGNAGNDNIGDGADDNTQTGGDSTDDEADDNTQTGGNSTGDEADDTTQTGGESIGDGADDNTQTGGDSTGDGVGDNTQTGGDSIGDGAGDNTQSGGDSTGDGADDNTQTGGDSTGDGADDNTQSGGDSTGDGVGDNTQTGGEDTGNANTQLSGSNIGNADTQPGSNNPGIGSGEPGTAKTEQVLVTNIKISGISKKIAAGKSVKLEAFVTPEDASNTELIWESNNEDYATVNADGVVKTKKAGKNKKVTITAKAADGSGVKKTYTIKIMPNAVKKITLKAEATTLKVGQKLKLAATVTPKLSSKKMNSKLKWSSSNTSYATVSTKGVVKARKAGKGKKVRITARATDGSAKKKTITIRIK